MAAAKTVTAGQTTTVEVDGQTVVVLAGSTFKATDPVVKAGPHIFETAGQAEPETDPPVESATAGPGEKRRTSRSK
jgi:hypothetical protein